MKLKLFALCLVLLILSVVTGCGGGSNQQVPSLLVYASSGGYSPQVLEIKKNSTVVLNFEAATNLGCAGDLEIPQFGIRQRLTPGKTTPIEIKPVREGIYQIRCSMNMFTAMLTVK